MTEKHEHHMRCAEDKRCASCKSKDFECVGVDRPWYWQCLPKKAARAEVTQDEAEEEPTPPPRIPEGCTDRLASNFDLAAQKDDGSAESWLCASVSVFSDAEFGR